MGKGNHFPTAIFKGSLEKVGVLVAAENPKVASLLTVPAIDAGFDFDSPRSKHEQRRTFLTFGIGRRLDFNFHIGLA